jgi:phosphonate transport system permease protein
MTRLDWRRALRTTAITAALLAAYFIAYRGSAVDFARLVESLPKGWPLLRAFLTPDVANREIQPVTLQLPFPVPCGSAEQATSATSGPRLVPSVLCAAPRDKIVVEGFELPANTSLQLRWRLPSGQYLPGPFVTTDGQGHFSANFEARPIIATKDGVPSKLEVEVLVEVGGLRPSPTLRIVVDNIIVTIFMALLATTIASVVAVPLAFLAAHNITGSGPLGRAVYGLSRMVLNIGRSFEPLVLGMVFAFWVGFGPFPGVIALTVITVASLGKLYAEAVEHIDPGPLEAVSATGANRLQTIVYGVMPQIVPDFLSYTIYHWDINVRISTIIGFVGGGGIGYFLSQMINTSQNHKAGTAIWAIVLVVWAMDFLSAEVRKRFT